MSEERKSIKAGKLVNKNPDKRLLLTIKEQSVKTEHIVDNAITPQKVSPDAVQYITADIQNQIDSIQIGGWAISNQLGNDPHIGISQKALTDIIGYDNAPNTVRGRIKESENTIDSLETSLNELEIGLDNCIKSAEKGEPSGVATLDVGGKVPSLQLPSYVDDVLDGYFYNNAFYADENHTQLLDAEKGKIYVDVPTKVSYRYSGSAYVAISNPYFPDEEDLTVSNDIIKFKDKAYNASAYSGLGRKILRKNMVGGVNTLTQSMVNAANTEYVIQYDFTLGESITIPAGCVLKFDGGSIKNGTLTLNGAIIESERIKIFDNITITPENYLALRTSWFGLNGNEDCSTVLTSLLNSIQTNSTLYIDSLLRIDNPVVAPTRLLYSRIVGDMDNNEVINPYMITSNITPSTTEDTSLLSIRGEGVTIENIKIHWGSEINTLKNTYILNITPVGQEGDNVIKNCVFNKWFASPGAVLRHKGRGLYVNNCTFNCIGMYAKDDIPPSAIELEGAGGAETTPDFIIPENSMRRIIIEDNTFHSGYCYMVKFLQNPDNADTTFVNACFRNNSCDVNMGCLYSNAKHRGLLFANNVVTGYTRYENQSSQEQRRNFEFHNYFDGVKICNNSFMNYKDRKSNGEVAVTFESPIECGSIEVSGNYYDLSVMSHILGMYSAPGDPSTIDSITVKDNVLSKNTFKYSGASSANSVVNVSRFTVKKLVCVNNVRNSPLNESINEYSVICYPTLTKGVCLFNEGFGTDNDVAAGSVIIKDSDIINAG